MGKAHPWRGRSLGGRVDLPCTESVHVRRRGNQYDRTWCDEKPQSILHSAKLSKEVIPILR